LVEVLPVRAYGTPLVVDTILRPLLGGVRWFVGLVGGGLLYLLGLSWWVPVPLVLATVVIEVVLALRSDRAIRADLTDDKLVVDDRFSPTLTIRRDDVHTAVVLSRRRGEGHEVVVVLGSRRRVLLAIAFQLAESPAEAVDVDAVDVHLQAQAGILRAVAPPTRAVRQRFDDRAFYDALLQWVPGDARRRVGLRLWPGSSPPLTVFGHHADDAPRWMVCEGDRYEVVDAEGEVVAQGALVVRTVDTARRDAVLLRVAGLDEPDVGTLPLLLLGLDGGLTLAVPAPARAAESHEDAPEQAHHTHAPEASALLHRLAPADMPPPWADDTGEPTVESPPP
jgi:hypothetical protein